MNPMAQAAIGSIVRWALTFLAGEFVARGIWSQADATQYVTAGSVALVTLGWSLFQKYTARVKLVTALSAHKPMSEETLEKRIEAGGVPSVATPKTDVPSAVLPALLLAALLGGAVVGLPACGGVSPKVAIDRADHAAFAAVRGFQQAEEQAWHARSTWPSEAQHVEINRKVSQAYQLIIDTANLGISLPPGSTLTPAHLAALSQLERLIADIVALATAAPVAVQSAASTAQSQVGALVVSVKGAR